MEINKNGRGCPRRALPQTTKTIKQKQPKQPNTLPKHMKIKDNCRGCPKGPYHKQTIKNSKQKQSKPPKLPNTSKPDGNQKKW